MSNYDIDQVLDNFMQKQPTKKNDLGQRLMRERTRITEAIAETKQAIAICRNNRTLNTEAKTKITDDLTAKLAEDINKRLVGMRELVVNAQETAQQKLSKSRPKATDLKDLAAVRMPGLNAMTNDELAQLYHSRDDKVERELVRQVVNLRIDSSPDTLNKTDLADKWTRLEQEFNPLYAELAEIQEIAGYADNLEKTINFDIAEMRGEQLETVDQVARTNAGFYADKFEQALEEKPQPDTGGAIDLDLFDDDEDDGDFLELVEELNDEEFDTA